MKTSEIKELSTAELKERIEDTKTLLVRQKFNHAVSPLENPMKIKKTRRMIASLLTEMRKREIVEINKK
ncbi:MAG: 50S ribosomal protein L29 [Bacteroidetes bacterium RIFOXYA12_FULL_35_11]|nr:MAG: 50S ribosomal protein L29 [Bacteroidetes bacterium GWF2_35_48]OFY79591.1 MAG: 50S ribosomal protein L29 [Bacteroidetes bacterium RIFOXYA12_FULL_35_11]OFY93137.1 MAG: 50S ribosomal protein L29 [Bacteroidetes bacterium RIFOXYC12_FULL_35_7]OFY96078.1 MAG: 50S ribosomal protein L29 [Bacteroidetes bacterium RIFOXYB2_FULL_35_7]HBX50542.1 50S ribosomal protein L29 [Bacteroidales bacterium]